MKKLETNPPKEFAFSIEEVNLFRQWFNTLEDTRKDYLELDDYRLGKKVIEIMDMRVSNYVLDQINKLTSLNAH